MLNDIKIGADPELFAFDTSTQEYISAHPFFPGTKEKPFPIPLGALQLDGMAAELNIDPASNREEFVRNVRGVLNETQRFLPKNVELVPKPSVRFNQALFDSVPTHYKELGCNPDFNAWRMGTQNESPIVTDSLRAAGGHIHISWNPEEPKGLEDPNYLGLCCAVVQQMDAYLGLKTTQWDAGYERTKLYGKAGAHRPKKYGVEYRTPGPSWLQTEDRMLEAFDLVLLGIENFNKGYFPFVDHPEIQEIINTGDAEKAKELHNAILKH